MSSFHDPKELARSIRIHALQMTSAGGGSHIASCMSVADIIATLYGRVLRVNPKDPAWPDRDRFILSKGHAGAALYAALAECGFFPVEMLDGHYINGSKLSGHVSHLGVPGVEISTGSLGHGLSIGAGMAYSAKLRHQKQMIVCLMSDGECDEGSVWEAVLFSAHHKLDRLVAVIDYNKIQSLDTVDNTMRLEPFADKWRSFGWVVHEVDGHDHEAMEQLFSALRLNSEAPAVVLAHTVKGKGVSFMEHTVLWHYRVAKDEEFNAAMKELKAR